MSTKSYDRDCACLFVCLLVSLRKLVMRCYEDMTSRAKLISQNDIQANRHYRTTSVSVLTILPYLSEMREGK